MNNPYSPQNNFNQIRQASQGNQQSAGQRFNNGSFSNAGGFTGASQSRMGQMGQVAGPSYAGPTNAINAAANGMQQSQQQQMETPQQFISDWQNSHPISGGMNSLVNDAQAAGYNNISPYMYGNTQSGNELNVGGEKYKVMGAEGTPNQYWYKPGMDDSGGNQMGGSQNIMQLLQQLLGNKQYAGSMPQQVQQQQMKPQTSLAPAGYGPQSSNQNMDISSFLGRGNQNAY